MATQKHKNAGFTFIEVIVAAVILGIALVPILRALTITNTQANFTEQQARSLSLAKGRMERIRAQAIYNYGNSFSVDSEPLGNGYLCSVSDSSRGLDLRKIKIEVGYDTNSDQHLSNQETSATLSSYVARRANETI